jgi:hypothetical protein
LFEIGIGTPHLRVFHISAILGKYSKSVHEGLISLGEPLPCTLEGGLVLRGTVLSMVPTAAILGYERIFGTPLTFILVPSHYNDRGRYQAPFQEGIELPE